MKNKNIIISVVLLVVGLGAGFLGGYEYRSFALRRSFGNLATGSGAQRFTANRNGQGVAPARAGMVVGSVIAIDDKSITVKMSDGSTKIVLFSGSTTYSNTVSASQSDLKVGTEVSASGAANSDGSVTATSIQINPQFGRPTPAPSPTP
jgi:hypothetical protein